MREVEPDGTASLREDCPPHTPSTVERNGGAFGTLVRFQAKTVVGLAFRAISLLLNDACDPFSTSAEARFISAWQSGDQ